MKTMKNTMMKRLLAAGLGTALLALVPDCLRHQGRRRGSGDAKKPTIGVIQFAVHASLDNCYTGLLQGLEEAGYKDGETCTIDFKMPRATPQPPISSPTTRLPRTTI